MSQEQEYILSSGGTVNANSFSSSKVTKQDNGYAMLSEEVQDVISYRPHWLVRKGNTLFFVILSLLLLFTWFIKYPDIIESEARLMSFNPPQMIKAQIPGRLQKLFTDNTQQVKKGQHLGYLESTGDYREIMQLQAWVMQAIDTIQNDRDDYKVADALPRLNGLGEMQASYQQFQDQLEITRQTMGDGYYQKKRMALQKDLAYIGSLKKNIGEQLILQQHDQQLQKKEYDAYESLAKDKVIAPMELDQYKSKLLNKQQGLEQLNAEITNNEIVSHNKHKEILDLQKQVADQRQQFHSSLLALKSELEKWINRYVFVAPETGEVLFGSTLKESEWISDGQVLFYIQPPQSSCYAELMTAQGGLGKLRKDQRVILEVEGYPADEFGYLEGSVDEIAGISGRRDSFLVKAQLMDGLQTKYKKPVFFRNGLKAHARIITDDRKLCDRLLGQLRQLWSR